ncbi:hypothetical protein VPH35_022932 [Triticum aestivum]
MATERHRQRSADNPAAPAATDLLPSTRTRTPPPPAAASSFHPNPNPKSSRSDSSPHLLPPSTTPTSTEPRPWRPSCLPSLPPRTGNPTPRATMATEQQQATNLHDKTSTRLFGGQGEAAWSIW